MAEQTGTGANESSPADALTSPVNDGFNRVDPSVECVSDVDGIPAKEGKSADAAPDKADAKTGDDKGAVKDDKDLDRFDKHPRFKELEGKITDLQTKLAMAEGKLSVLTPAEKAEAKNREDQGLPYKDITKLDPDPARNKELLQEWMEDDPVGYAANLYQQIYHEINTDMAEKQASSQRTTSIEGTYKEFETENPDFKVMWDSGQIKEFMSTHPGHNAMSAYLSMNKEKSTADAVAKAVKEAEERVKKNFQAKRNATVISDGGSVKTDGEPDELKHPDKYGGVVAVGAARLARLRQAAAGG